MADIRYDFSNTFFEQRGFFNLRIREFDNSGIIVPDQFPEGYRSRCKLDENFFDPKIIEETVALNGSFHGSCFGISGALNSDYDIPLKTVSSTFINGSIPGIFFPPELPPVTSALSLLPSFDIENTIDPFDSTYYQRVYNSARYLFDGGSYPQDTIWQVNQRSYRKVIRLPITLGRREYLGASFSRYEPDNNVLYNFLAGYLPADIPNIILGSQQTMFNLDSSKLADTGYNSHMFRLTTELNSPILGFGGTQANRDFSIMTGTQQFNNPPDVRVFLNQSQGFEVELNFTPNCYFAFANGKGKDDILIRVDGSIVPISSAVFQNKGTTLQIVLSANVNIGANTPVTVTIEPDTLIWTTMGDTFLDYYKANTLNSNLANFVHTAIPMYQIPLKNEVQFNIPLFVNRFTANNGQSFGYKFDRQIDLKNHLTSGTKRLRNQSTGDEININPTSPSIDNESCIYVTTEQLILGNTYIDIDGYDEDGVNTDGIPRAGNRRISPGSFVADTGATTLVPEVVFVRVNSTGTQISIRWNTATKYKSGVAQFNTEFSFDNTLNLSIPSSGDGTFTWIYTLSTENQIRENDSFAINIPAGFGEDVQTESEDSLAYLESFLDDNDNQSNIPWPAPELLSGEVSTDGRTISLTFDIDVRVIVDDNGPLIDQFLNILAKDTGDDEIILYPVQPNTVSPLTAATKVISFTSQGILYRSADEDIAINSSNIAGMVGNYASVVLDVPQLLPPIDNPTTGPISSNTDFDNSYQLTNNSTEEKPVDPVVPTYDSASITQVGDPPQQILRIVFDDGTDPISIRRSPENLLPTLTGNRAGQVDLEFREITSSNIDNDTIVFNVTSEPFILQRDFETASLFIPEDLVRSIATDTPNAEVSEFNQGTDNFENNSEFVPPAAPFERPEIRDAFVGEDGRLVGLYFNTDLSGSRNTQLTVYGTLTGTRTFTLASNDPGDLPVDQTLATYRITTLPVFRGEKVYVTGDQGLVTALNDGNFTVDSLPFERFLARNNSLIPVPPAPVLDTAVLATNGFELILTFSIPVKNGTADAYVIASKTGKHKVKFDSVNVNIVTAIVSGKVYEDETVELFLPKDFVVESTYSFTSNAETNNFTVDVSSRTTDAPDLPPGAEGLSSEAL